MEKRTTRATAKIVSKKIDSINLVQFVHRLPKGVCCEAFNKYKNWDVDCENC